MAATGGPAGGGEPGDGDGLEWHVPEVFDEAFVKGGVHEPPARTRAAIAQHGLNKSSWRHSPPGAPVDLSRVRRRRGWVRRHWLVVIAAIAAVTVAVVTVTNGGFRSNGVPNLAGVPEQPAATTLAPAPVGPAVTTTVPTVQGFSNMNAIGTCFDATNLDSTTQPAMFTKTDCQSAHDLEMTGIIAAAGADQTYPDATYWRETVNPTCIQTVIDYTGVSRASWPGAWHQHFLQPAPDGWRGGDRQVTCFLRTTPKASGSARHKDAAPRTS